MNAPGRAASLADRFSAPTWTRGLVWLLAAVSLACGGCARSFWREYADWEVYNLVRHAGADPRWTLDNYTINIDPRSRLFDPFSPDRPPMPPDDPAAHRLMHCVDCKQGFPCWHQNGNLRDVERRDWRTYLPRDQEGQLLLNRRTAMELGLLHSREYQQNLETLYLSALDVTFERFRFDTQFFGGDSTFYTADGRVRGGGESASTLSTASTFQGRPLQARKVTASGGQLIVGLANSLVWQFSGPDEYAANTILDFSIVQPLLRAGGRAVVLERLTRVERGLLANLRSMELYRMGFYIDVITGASNVQGPTRQGGFFGGSGLENFAGVGGGGFGRVGGLGAGAVASGAGGAGAGAQRASGLLGLLQQRIEIQNIEANVAGLRDSLAQLQAAYDAGRIDKFQVDLARQNLYLLQSALLNTKAGYEFELDTYLISLGLPPTVRTQVEDRLLDQFQLIDPRLTARQDRLNDLLDELRDPERPAPEDVVADDLARLEVLRRETGGQVAVVERDLELLRRALPARRRALAGLQKRAAVESGEVESDIYDVADFDRRTTATQRDFVSLVERFETTSAELRTLVETSPPPAADELRRQLIDLATRLSGHLGDLLLVQARARLDAADLVPVEVTPEQAVQLAAVNRLDWMNARQGVLESWRLVEFNANSLRSSLNVLFSGDIRTTDNNPLQFRSSNGRLRVGVEFDAPLTRIAERNNYRQALIEYQQARRAYMAFRDRLALNLRNRVRQVELNQLNFEIRRAAVLLAISQVELTRLRLDEPPQPGETTALNNTTARDLIDALNNLASAQNDFLSVWVNFEVQRLGLDFELGTMRLDERGVWIDPGPIEYPAKASPGEVVAEDPEAELPPEVSADLSDLKLLPLPEAISPVGEAAGSEPAAEVASRPEPASGPALSAETTDPLPEE